MDHVESFYAATQGEEEERPPLAAAIEAEVCVIGAGLAGLTTAKETAEAGVSTVVLESNRVSWGASGRNGGFVSPGYAAGQPALEKRLGLDRAKTLYRLSETGVDYVRKIVDAEPSGKILGGRGWLKVIRHDAPEVLKRRRDHAKEVYGSNLVFWPKDKLRETLRTTRYFAGLQDPRPFHIDPLAYANRLAELAEQAGARIYEQSGAKILTREGAGWLIETDEGRVKARHVVLAGSAYDNGLWPGLSRAILPVATYVVTSEPLGERLAGAVRFSGCIADTRRAGDYYRIVDGDRLLWGGRITTRCSQPRALAKLLKRDILTIYPQLGDFQIDYAWSGLMGYCAHKMPIIGALKPGLWACTAFGGHGLAASGMGGRLIADAIAKGDDSWRLFLPFAARWGGGAIGQAATQAAYWGMQAQDWWQERRGAA